MFGKVRPVIGVQGYGYIRDETGYIGAFSYVYDAAALVNAPSGKRSVSSAE